MSRTGAEAIRNGLRRYGAVLLYLACGGAVAAIALSLDDIGNYRAFAHAARDLVAGLDLYARDNAYYKYPPPFALAFWLFAWAPEAVGVVAWCLANFGVAALALHLALPDASRRRGMLVALVGILAVTDADQSNLLIGGLMLLATLFYWRERYAPAAAATVLGGVVKVFPLAAGLWALHTRAPLRALAWIAAFGFLAAASPLLVTSPALLAAQYKAWLAVTLSDYSWLGWSIPSLLARHGAPVPVTAVELLCVAFGLAPIAFRARAFSERQRLEAAACLLITLVLANHKSEVQTYVIAAMGVGIWYAAGAATWGRLAFAGVVLLSLAPIYPAAGGVPHDLHTLLSVQRPFFSARLVPYIALWLMLVWRLWQREEAARPP